MDHLVWTPPIDHHHDYESDDDDNELDGDEVDLVDVGSDTHDD